MTQDEAGIAVMKLADVLRGFFLNAGVGGDDVDDCLSETWMRVVSSLDDYDPTYDFGPWVMGCAKHALLDWQRQNTYGRDRRKIEYVKADKLRFLAAQDILENRILEKIDRERLQKAVRYVIGTMTPRQQRIMTRHYLEGVPYKDLCVEENCTQTALKQAAIYARERFRKTVESLIDPSKRLPYKASKAYD